MEDTDWGGVTSESMRTAAEASAKIPLPYNDCNQHLPPLWDSIPSAPRLLRDGAGPSRPALIGCSGRGGAGASDASAGRVTWPPPPRCARGQLDPAAGHACPSAASPALSAAPGSAKENPPGAVRSPAPRGGQPGAALGQVSARRRLRGRRASRGAVERCGGGGGKGRSMHAPEEVLEPGGGRVALRRRESAGGAAPRSVRKVRGRWRGEALVLGSREGWVG